MGKVIAPLADGKVPEHTIFDKRFVLECCERFHIHWRNMRLELTADNWIEFVRTFEEAIATWRSNGSPREHFHLELAKHLMDTKEIVHPTSVEVELCENLYKSMRETHGADAEFWHEDAFVHFHYRDLRFEMSIADFLGFSETMASARERLRTMLFKPVSGLFEQLNDANILYVVLRNWESLPHSVAVGPHSDLDLLVHPAHVAKLDELWAAQRTHTEPYRVQRKVPVLGPSGEQSYLLTDIRTTGDGYMPEAFSHALLARRVPEQMFFVLPPREHFLSLLYHAAVHKGVMSADYARKLTALAREAGIDFPPGRINDLGHHLALLREHGVEPSVPDDHSVLPRLPFAWPAETAISSRVLDIHEGRAYHSRVHVLDGVVHKQTSFDLAAREYTLLSRLGGPLFPRALATGAGAGWTSVDLELVAGVGLSEAALDLDGARALTGDCLTILEELASAGIVHRDIKPDNIIVRDGRPVLIDFGWATAPDLPHVTPLGLGDDGKPADGFCDTYAMGVALAGAGAAFAELAPVIEAMTRPARADRVTDLTELRALLDAPSAEAIAAASERLTQPEAPAPDEPGEPRVHVLAYAEELIADPGLIVTFAAAFAGRPASLIAYAPDADPGEIGPRLEAVLPQVEADIVLVPVERTDEGEQSLAAAAAAFLSSSPAEGIFASLPRLDAGQQPSVSIVIPVFNRLDLTQQCLDAIAATAAGTAHEVIVVDNASTDGTAEFLRTEEKAGRLRCIVNAENEGFGGACNKGVELARGELVVLLNNDTIPRAGWLSSLVETMADETVGIAGSRLLYPDGRIQHAGIVWNGAGHLDHVHRGAAADDPAVLVPRDFAAVTGACLIIRRATFFELGAFDPAYRMYVEDVDLCIRAWNAGLRVTYCPTSVVVHLENASVTDLAWRDENVIAGWKHLQARWSGRWPAAVRRLAWPHKLPGSPLHLAALCFADDVVEHPELVAEWARVFGADDAKLVVYGRGYDAARLTRTLEDAFLAAGIDTETLDALAIAAPDGSAPAPVLIQAVAAVLASEPATGDFAVLPWADEHGIEALRGTAAGVALAG